MIDSTDLAHLAEKAGGFCAKAARGSTRICLSLPGVAGDTGRKSGLEGHGLSALAQQGKLSHIINLVSPGTQFNISNKVEMLS